MTDEPVAIKLPVVTGDRWLAGTGRLSVAARLSLIVAVSAIIRAVLASTVPVPVIFPDELMHWELGRGLGESGRMLIGDQPVTWWTSGPLYPLLIAPTHLVAGSLVDAYELTKILNAIVMSLAAVPAYFLARRVVSARGSLVSAALAVLLPSAVYSTHVMAESLTYPLFLCAMLAIAAALARPSVGRQLMVLAVITLTGLSRAEMFVLFPAFAFAIVLLCWRGAPSDSAPSFWRRLWSFNTTWLVYGAGGLPLFNYAAGGNLGPTGLPNAQEARVLLGPVRPEAAPMNFLRHLADLDIYSGVIPFAAFALFAVATLVFGTANRRRLEFAVLSVSTAFFVVALAALYETSFKLHGVIATHVFDRYVFYVVPLFVIALVVWVEDLLPRPRRTAIGVATGAALLPLALPLGVLLTGTEWGTTTSNVGLIPLVWAKELLGEGWLLRALLLCCTSSLAFVFLRARPQQGWALVRICVVVFVLFSMLVTASNASLSERVSRDAGRNALDWVDRAAGHGSEVAIVWRGTKERPGPQRVALREAELFNRSIGPVYDLEDPLLVGFPSTSAMLRDNRVLTSSGSEVDAAYVVAHRSLRVVGRPVASDEGSGLVLYRVDGPVRVH